MNVISNTTVLTNFARIGELKSLQQLFGVLYIPTEVYAEIQDAQKEGYRFFADIDQSVAPYAAQGWLHLATMSEDELRLFGSFPARLHRGERACLAIAQHRHWLVLTDDRDARLEARHHAITISGSIGCLLLAIERKIATLDQANRWLAAMVAEGYYAPIQDLSLAIKPKGNG